MTTKGKPWPPVATPTSAELLAVKQPTITIEAGIGMRQNVERNIVTRLVDHLFDNNYSISIDEELSTDVYPKDKKGELLAIVFDVDEVHLYPTKPDGKHAGFVFLVFGNDGPDVIADYSTNLESVLAPINAYAETFQ